MRYLRGGAWQRGDFPGSPRIRGRAETHQAAPRFLKKCERTPETQAFIRKIGKEVKWKEFAAAEDLNREIWQGVGTLLINGVRQYRLSANDVVILTIFLSQLPKVDVLTSYSVDKPMQAQPSIQATEREQVNIETPKIEGPRILASDHVSDLEYKMNWLLMKGRLQDAETMGNELVQSEPHNPRAWHLRGIARRQMGDFRGALTDYEKSLSLDPRSGKTYYSRGMLYGIAGDLDRAIEDMKKAMELEPGYSPIRETIDEIEQLRKQGKHKLERGIGVDMPPSLRQYLIEKFGE